MELFRPICGQADRRTGGQAKRKRDGGFFGGERLYGATAAAHREALSKSALEIRSQNPPASCGHTTHETPLATPIRGELRSPLVWRGAFLAAGGSAAPPDKG